MFPPQQALKRVIGHFHLKILHKFCSFASFHFLPFSNQLLTCCNTSLCNSIATLSQRVVVFFTLKYQTLSLNISFPQLLVKAGGNWGEKNCQKGAQYSHLMKRLFMVMLPEGPAKTESQRPMCWLFLLALSFPFQWPFVILGFSLLCSILPLPSPGQIKVNSIPAIDAAKD